MEESPGQRIVRLRLAKGWNQARLAWAVSVGQSSVSAWENDRYEPDREHAEMIARALEVTVDDLGLSADERMMGEPPPAVPPPWFEQYADQLGVIQKQLLRIEALLTEQVSAASAQAESQHP